MLMGCTDNGLLIRSNGEYKNKIENVIYMIGEPYKIQEDVFTPAENYVYMEEGNAGWYSYDDKNMITQNGEVYQKDKLTAMHRTLPLPSIVKITNIENNKTAIVRVNDRGPMVKDRIIDVSEETAKVLDFNKEGVTKVLVEILPLESQRLKDELLKKEAMDAVQSLNINPPSQNQTDYEIVSSITPLKQKTTKKVEPKDEVVEENDIVYSYQKHKKSVQENIIIQIGAFRNRTTAQNILDDLSNYQPYIVQKIVNGTELNCVQISTSLGKNHALNILDKVHQSGYAEARIITKRRLNF